MRGGANNEVVYTDGPTYENPIVIEKISRLPHFDYGKSP
jgi:hypothetical protein